MAPRQITETSNLVIPLADGTSLSARVWMPTDADQNPVPAILEYLPYRKRDGTYVRDEMTHPHFAAHGYACLRVDIRGNGDSQGVMTDEYSQQELADAVEVITWIATQPWCTGKVGMMGISWGGFNALQVAALRPKPLHAIITLCSTADRFADDIHYKGGCLLNENLGWAATMLAYSARPPDPMIVGDAWRDMWLDRLRSEPHLAEIWTDHQHRDAYWKHGSVCEDFSAIETPTLAIGGWGDGYKNTVQTLLENLAPVCKGIVGPWIHKYPHFADPHPRIDFLGEALRWWDRWLKDKDTGADKDPDLRLYLMESEAPKPWYETRQGRWIAQDYRTAPVQTSHLGALGLSADATPFKTRLNCPADTGMASGEYCAIWLGPDLPGDQRRDDAYSATFDSAELDHNVAVVGAPKVTLTLVSDKPVAQIAVRLNDVHPDGKVSRITYGVLNLCHRSGSEFPTPLPVGEPVSVTITLDQIAYDIPQGHRLRLAISNAYWPLVWPAPEATDLCLTAGKIELPLLHETGVDVQFDPPRDTTIRPLQNLRPQQHSRTVRLDQVTGETHLDIVDDFGADKQLDHGLISGSVARECWSIHPENPNSARGRIHWTTTRERGDWNIRTETYSQMWSDARHFHLTARIEAYEQDILVFEKDFSHKVRRNLV